MSTALSVSTVRDLRPAPADPGVRITELLDAVTDNLPMVLCTFDLDLTFSRMQGQGLQAAGLDPAMFLGRRAEDVFGHRPDLVGFMDSVLGGSEERFAVEVFDVEWNAFGSPIREDGVVVGGMVIALDVTTSARAQASLAAQLEERQELERERRQRALTDELTGLPNRADFIRRLVAAVAEAEQRGSQVTVVFLDLDHFKLVNDSWGHAEGDALLQLVADRLQETVRDDDLVARLTSDEFVIMCNGGSEELSTSLAQRVADAISQPVEICGEDVFVSASIGVAVTGEYDAHALLRHADAAMFRAKKKGRDRIEIFDQSIEDEAHLTLTLRSEMRHALERDQFVLHFQPIMNLDSGRLDGMEALIRWIHPERGMVPPLDFIPAAEESGLIVELGGWVLREACREAANWPAPLHIAVNLSVCQLADRSIVATVADALERSGLAPDRLVLEITESALMANAEMALGCLNELKRLGVRLAIDDFGTGYSSLVYLRRMPVDIIKVDQSFVGGLGDDAEDTAIVASVVHLAHAVGVKAVAEGVETLEQHEHLKGLGCDLAQGYLFSRPIPAHELAAVLAPQFSTSS